MTSYYSYDTDGRLVSYTPAIPAGYGAITYTWNNLGQKTSMTVPLGVQNQGRRIAYLYDRLGKQVGMDVVPVSVTSSTTPPSTDPGSTTRFAWDANENRVKLTNKAGDVYYFVYDPTASIPAVVYEQGTTGSSTNRYLNIREPDGALVSRETYGSSGCCGRTH